MNPEFSMVE